MHGPDLFSDGSCKEQAVLSGLAGAAQLRANVHSSFGDRAVVLQPLFIVDIFGFSTLLYHSFYSQPIGMF